MTASLRDNGDVWHDGLGEGNGSIGTSDVVCRKIDSSVGADFIRRGLQLSWKRRPSKTLSNAHVSNAWQVTLGPERERQGWHRARLSLEATAAKVTNFNERSLSEWE
jgi:hypothetical protein